MSKDGIFWVPSITFFSYGEAGEEVSGLGRGYRSRDTVAEIVIQRGVWGILDQAKQGRDFEWRDKGGILSEE